MANLRALPFLLLPALAGLLSAPAPSQTTIYVDGLHGSDQNNGTSPSSPVKTLTKGISLVTAGGTVKVAPADYAESVVLTKSLTLEGAGPQITRNLLPSGKAFRVQAARVTLSGIGASVGSNGSGDAPVSLEAGASGTRLLRLTLSGGESGILAGAAPDLLVEACNLGGGGQIHGIRVTGDSDRVVLRACTFSNLKGTALLADPGPGAVLEGWVLRDCTFLNFQAPTVSPGACLEMPRVKGLLVERCDFSGFAATALLFANPARTSSGTEPPPESLVIRDNLFHRNFGGADASGKGVITFRYGISGLDLARNRIEGTRDASGIYFEAAPSAAWQAYQGIRISGNTVRGLTGCFRGSKPGTWDADGVTLEGLSPAAWDPANLLRGNNFSGNAGMGLRNVGAGAPLVDARWNWWGSASGPSAPGGDGVSGNVDASSPLATQASFGIRAWRTGGRPAELLAAELDGKNGPDLAALDYENGKVEILLADGRGGFLPPTAVSVGRAPCRIAAGDFDGDGDLDLAVGNTFDGTVSILTNHRGAFTVSATLSCGVPVTALAAGKVGTDGRDDLVAAVCRTPFLPGKVLYFDNASGTPSQVVGLTDPADLALGDMDGDGDLDLVVVQAGSNPGVTLVENKAGALTGTQAGPFALGVSQPIQVDLALGDLDRDGRTDVILGMTPMISLPLKPSEVRVLFGAKGLSLQASRAYFQGKGFLRVCPGDAQGNGFQDLFAADLAAGTVVILEDLSPTQHTFTRTLYFCPSPSPRGLTTADLDGDGCDEALVSSFSTQDVSATSFALHPWAVSFGTGCPGAAGTPRIQAQGNPVLGNLTFQVGLTEAAPWTAAILLASSSVGGTLEVGPCQVVVLGPAASGFAGTDGAGKASLPLPIPLEPSLLGGTAYFQWFALDKKGLLGPGYYSSTPGLRIKLGR